MNRKLQSSSSLYYFTSANMLPVGVNLDSIELIFAALKMVREQKAKQWGREIRLVLDNIG